MGLVENGTEELESNEIEKLKTTENLAQNPNCQPLTPDNYKLDSEMVVTSMEQKKVTGAQNFENNLVSTKESSMGMKEMEPSPGGFFQNFGSEKREPVSENVNMYSEIVVTSVEQKKVTGAQNFENNLVSTKESSTGIKEMEPSPGGFFQNFGSEKRDRVSENVNMLPVLENLEMPPQDGLTSLANLGIPTGNASVNPGYEKLKSKQKDAINEPGHLENEVKGINAQPKNRKDKLRTPVTGSWVLRSKIQEKPKAPEPDDTVKEGSGNREKKRRGRKKEQTKKSSASEFSRTRTHLRYLLHRIKYEQSLIDAYSAEGWKGQSLEKLKPEKELQRAKSHILHYKLRIRELFQHLDLSLAVGKLPESLFDPVGEIDSEDIFCAKCGSKDLSLDNDIILCDGTCERGFHQFCLEPPLLEAEIPPDEEGWLCPGCDCKVDCIDMLKDFQGTNLSIVDTWEKIFPEAAAAAAGKTLDDGSGSSSDDSEDNDFDPDKPETVEKVQGDESSSDESNYFSASDDLETYPNNEKYLGLPSDDSADDDFDPTAPDQDKQVKQSSSSSDFTSNSEDLGALLDDATMPGKDLGHISPSSDCKWFSTGSKEKNPEGRMKGRSLNDELAYLMETSDEPVSGKRHIERLDYQKLLEETYGNSSSDSSDEDFGDTTAPKRRKISRQKTVVGSTNKTPITKSKIYTKAENQKESQCLPKSTRKNLVDGGTNESLVEAVSASTGTKKSAHKRLGDAITQRLYESFNNNQYPGKAVKENLAKELGLTIQQVSKWFENTRWNFHHRSRMESNITEKPPEPQATIVTEHTPFNQVAELHESNAIPADNHILGASVENFVTDTSGGNSGTWKSRKMKGKIDQATDDISVTNKTPEQNMQVDMQSPQLGKSSKRQTRSNRTIS